MTTENETNGSDGSRSIDGLVSLSISYVRWQYEDELPEMSDEDFNAIFPASRVIGNQSVGVRMYPFVEDKNGERIWLSSLGYTCLGCRRSSPKHRL